MRPFLRSLPSLIALGFVLVACAAIGFLPLFEGPGYEIALAIGLIVPAAAALATAFEVSSSHVSPFDALSRGAANGAALVAVAYLTTLAHGLRVGFCDALTGSWTIAAGPGVGCVLAGVWGAFAGLAVRRGAWLSRTRIVLLALAAPLLSIVVSVARFYTSPMVFAFDPFVGYFSGTLYDTVIDSSGLLTYRLGSAATLIAAFAASLHIARDASGGLHFGSALRPGAAVLGLAALAASISVTAFGSALGHYQTPSTVAEILGGETNGERCDVIHPRAMRKDEVQRFTRECDAHVRAEEAWFGLPKASPERRVRAYLFGSVEQKASLMGAAKTQIAKPWRREIYVQAAGYPHPSLGHEIAHVLAGDLARGPFKIAGSVGGLLPNPGLIEGIAVAASPPDDELSPREWAKAMKDLELLPPLSTLFAFGFLGESSSVAYTASGAFVTYVRDRFGTETIGAWYGGAALDEETKSSWADLERDFHADLDTLSLSEAAMAQAKARFDKPAIFARRCPHEVDACVSDADALAAAGDVEGAIEGYERALRLDPSAGMIEVAIARAQIEGDAPQKGLDAMTRVEQSPMTPANVRDRAIEILGDQALQAGEGNEAARRYHELLARSVDEDRLRTLDVKIAAANDERAREAVVELLIGRKGRDPDRVRAAALLGAWAEQVHDAGLPRYLLARQAFNAGDFTIAAAELDRALAGRIDLPRVAVETLRLRAITACGLGDDEGAKRAGEAYAARPEVTAALKQTMQRLVERCTSAPPK